MKALIFSENKQLELVEREIPACAKPDDVLVRVVQTGICGTDRGILLGKFPAKPGVIMGHEAVGEVVEAHLAGTVAPGARVIVNPTLYCGECLWCRRGQLSFCANKEGNEIGVDRDGAFAEFIRIEARFLYPIPADMSYDRATLVEPLACVLNNVNAAGLRPGDTAVVLGAGPIGLITSLVADHFGCTVTVAETDSYRRRIAADIFAKVDGCRVRLAPLDGPAGQARVVFDTVGNLLPQACDLAENAGTVVIVGFNKNAEATLRPLHVLQRGLRIVGAGDYNSLAFPQAIELARHLPLDMLISHRFALDEHQDAMRAIGIGGTGYQAVKVVIACGV